MVGRQVPREQMDDAGTTALAALGLMSSHQQVEVYTI